MCSALLEVSNYHKQALLRTISYNMNGYDYLTSQCSQPLRVTQRPKLWAHPFTPKSLTMLRPVFLVFLFGHLWAAIAAFKVGVAMYDMTGPSTEVNIEFPVVSMGDISLFWPFKNS